LQLTLASLWGNTLHQLHRIVGLEDFGLQFAHSTVQSKDGRLPNDNVNVASALLDACLKKLVDENSCGHAFDSMSEFGQVGRKRSGTGVGAAYQNVGSVDSIHSGSRLQRAPLDG
jgi:hypothetical protein